MVAIAIVGAGVAAAAATFALDRHSPGATVTVFEQSDRVAGRAATRRHDDLTYDYGANYVKADDPRVVDLLTGTLDTTDLVDVEEPIYTFDESGAVSPGRNADEHKWTYRDGIARLAERLFDRTDSTVSYRTAIDTVRREDGSWLLVAGDEDGTAHGPFDAVVLNPPAPGTAALLCDASWSAPVLPELVEAVEAVPYRSIWTAVLHYGFALDVPYYALVNTDKRPQIGWIAREECKPGHVPEAESLLVVQANHEWTVEHRDDDPDENVAALAALAADVVGDDRLTEPDWADHRYWRNALPEGRVDREPLRSAEDDGLYCVGDWVVGEARVHAALANGLEVGERLANTV